MLNYKNWLSINDAVIVGLFEDSLLKNRKCVIHIIMTYVGEVKLHYKQVQWNTIAMCKNKYKINSYTIQ